MKISLFWFRRDLRLEDNIGLNEALQAGFPVLSIFIFDENITNHLSSNDARISFIYESIAKMHQSLSQYKSSIYILKGNPLDIFKTLTETFDIQHVFTNKDYEPYAIQRDNAVKTFLESKQITLSSFKDQVIFEENEVVKDDGLPYTIYTPFKNKWLKLYSSNNTKSKQNIDFNQFLTIQKEFPTLESLGFLSSNIKVKPFLLKDIHNYSENRDFPFHDKGSYLSPHLRFGTVSIRQIIAQLKPTDSVFLSELIWREFFMQIIYHFPQVVTQSFKAKYDNIPWRNNEDEFALWCAGKTGYPMIDAGMRQLNQTGYMHNRVRMVVASFLCKHLLIDWRWGEAYFAEKLLDYDLSANNGNWQWAAGTGCDAAPYFRVFNPSEQIKKFDSKLQYIMQWVPELNDFSYQKPMVEHTFARNRAIETYKKALNE